MNNIKLGICGGGQLGKMLVQHTSKWGLQVHILDKSKDFPAGSVCAAFSLGDFKSRDDVYAFGQDKDVVTIEIESVNSDALHQLKNAGVTVHPDPIAVDIIKDKGTQKQFYIDHELPTGEFTLHEGLASVRSALAQNEIQFPFVLKARLDGYDGRGVTIVSNKVDLDIAFDGPCLVEKLIDIEKEISVIVARNDNGEIKSFPPVAMEFHPTANLVEYLYAPAEIGPALDHEAIQIAQAAIEAYGICGLLAVELFLTSDGELLINEVAPRPHNSGHHTIEACNVSQYEQHIRAILNLPLADIKLHRPAVMVNLLGAEGHTGAVKYQGVNSCLAMDDVHVHLYGKPETRPFRKMGHATVLADNLEEAKQKAKLIKDTIQILAQ